MTGARPEQSQELTTHIFFMGVEAQVCGLYSAPVLHTSVESWGSCDLKLVPTWDASIAGSRLNPLHNTGIDGVF